MGGRAKNISSVKDVAKVLRGVGLEQLPDEKDYMGADLSKIVEKYEDFLLDVCRLTPRPTTPLLQEGCSLVFKGVSKADCKAFCQDTRTKKSATSGKKLPPAVFRLLSVLRASNGETSCSPPRSSEKKRLSEASASGRTKPLLPVSRDQSRKSKVLKAYGMSTSRSLQPHESDGVLSIQQIFSSPKRLEISSAEDTAPAEDPPSTEVPLKEYYDSSKERQVRAYEDGKLEEISSPVHHRVKGKQPQKSSIRKKPASKKKAEKKATPSLGPEELEKIQKIIQKTKPQWFCIVFEWPQLPSQNDPMLQVVFAATINTSSPCWWSSVRRLFLMRNKDLAKEALKKIVDRQMTFNQAREQKHDWPSEPTGNMALEDNKERAPQLWFCLCFRFFLLGGCCWL